MCTVEETLSTDRNILVFKGEGKVVTHRAPPNVAMMAKKYTLCILGICRGALLSFHILAGYVVVERIRYQ